MALDIKIVLDIIKNIGYIETRLIINLYKTMTNTNSESLKNCDYCNSCNSCDYCYSCNSCNYCNSCYSCNSCNYCNSCDSCNYCNSCNSCKFSKGLRMSENMLFCLGDGASSTEGDGYQKNYMIFNEKVSPDEYNKILSTLNGLKLSATHWVEEDDMTADEKKENSQYKNLGGYLKYVSYKDMWANFWENASQKEKDLILDIPQFDEEIFSNITGIDITKDVKKDKELAHKKEQLIKKANELLAQAEAL